MRVLGIDPGTARCGYGLVEYDNSRLNALAHGVIQTSSSLAHSERLLHVYQGVCELITRFAPQALGLEQLFFNKNVRTAMEVGQARGVIILAAAQLKVPLLEFTPLQVKQAVVGYGRASKEQVIYMTQKLLALPEKPSPDDVADALAIGICALHTRSVMTVTGRMEN